MWARSWSIQIADRSIQIADRTHKIFEISSVEENFLNLYKMILGLAQSVLPKDMLELIEDYARPESPYNKVWEAHPEVFWTLRRNFKVSEALDVDRFLKVADRYTMWRDLPYTLGSDERYRLANSAYNKIYSLSKELEALGESEKQFAYELYCRMNPESRPRRVTWMRGGQSLNYEWTRGLFGQHLSYDEIFIDQFDIFDNGEGWRIWRGLEMPKQWTIWHQLSVTHFKNLCRWVFGSRFAEDYLLS